jgi:serine/threonine protein phosphatase 1
MVKNKFVIGDIHGSYKALLQCLDRSNFNYNNDLLISLGDICDGYPETKECVKELMKIKNIVLVLGNHDKWLINWIKYGDTPSLWTTQGGRATLRSYNFIPIKSHLKFLNKSISHYIDEENRLFVHGGIGEDLSIDKSEYELMWDRSFFKKVLIEENLVLPYKEIFIGHTTISQINKDLKPIITQNKKVFMLDTGAGFEGKLTIMNINTKEFWQSEKSIDLYGEFPR